MILRQNQQTDVCLEEQGGGCFGTWGESSYTWLIPADCPVSCVRCSWLGLRGPDWTAHDTPQPSATDPTYTREKPISDFHTLIAWDDVFLRIIKTWNEATNG